MPPVARLLRSRWLSWVLDLELLLELFVTSNLAVLAGDIVLAHSVNQFRRPEEYIPLYFSAGAPILLAVMILARWLFGFREAWRYVGSLIACLSILVGLSGVVYHLQSSFFAARTLRSLTYAAPFAAPLAYTGLGFLLLVNRMVRPGTLEWARWVLLLATGGFFGNFVLCLTDHASNGFFLKTEWIPVISSALATGFLLIPIFTIVSRRFLDACGAVLLAQAFVGILGFYLHVRMNLYSPGASLFDRVVNGAPPMAPLLFPNLVALAFVGLWELAPHLPEQTPERPSYFGRALQWWGITIPQSEPNSI